MNIYCKQTLTGGVSGCLDAIDGALLADGDRAIVITTSSTYHYILDGDSGAAESSPDVISPDTNAGTKRWIMVEDATGSGGGTTPTYQTYYPDADQADQGVASGDTYKTVYDIITAVGTSKVVKIVFRHTGSGNTTSYAFDTSLALTSYPNIFFEFEPGAKVSRVTGNEYFTVYSPGNVLASKAQTINTDYTLQFAKGGTTYPEWYGAKGDGSTDDTYAIQCAIAALPPVDGGVIEFAPKVYLYTTLNVGKPVHFKGLNRSTTFLRTTQASGNKISITAGRSCKFTDMVLDSSVTQTSGAFVYFYSATYENHGSLFENMIFNNCYTGIDFETCGYFTVKSCYFAIYNTAIYVNNGITPDNGSGVIQGCVFDAGSSSGTAINQRSAGGLKIYGNHFLQGQYHYYGLFYSSSNTSILHLEGNSLEHASSSCVYLSASGGTTFAKVMIANNQFAADYTGSTGINISNAGTFLDTVYIGNNLFNLGTSCTAMSIGTGSRVVIGPNLISGDGSYEVGLSFGSGVSSCAVHRQNMYNLTAGFSGVMTNVSFVDAYTLRGSSSGSASNSYGSGTGIYITNPINITFSTAFPKTPYVKVTPSTITGAALSAIASYVTTTGFQLHIMGITSGATLTCEWEASLTG